ncbi:hypothetical protein ACSVH2_00345 [Flavobacterium sp. RSB2_4_14]|uniref:hypothetical protein n=1 Tax=Flavobacterium sp. RSB2_4_14 TaxID=3447665 RepID=UPI003F3BD048
MKSKFLLFFIFISSITIGQDKKVYLDSTYIPTDEINQVYYQIIKDYKRDKPEYDVFQYYKTGELESERTSTSKDFLKNKGIAISYYKNGNKKNTITYNDKGGKEGKVLFWYENGQPKFEGCFLILTNNKDGEEIKETKLRVDSYWNQDNLQTVTNGFGQYTDDGFFDYLSNISISSGNIENGFKNGVWMGKDDKKGIIFTETYINGTLTNGKSIDKNGNQYTYDQAFVIAKAMGGMKLFYTFLGVNFKVPENIKKKVTVYTIFTVTSENQITKIRILSSAGKEIDDEAIRVIMAYNSFTSAKYRGMPIDSEFTLPITIKGQE